MSQRRSDLHILLYFSIYIFPRNLYWTRRTDWHKFRGKKNSHRLPLESDNVRISWYCRICQNRLMFLQGVLTVIELLYHFAAMFGFRTNTKHLFLFMHVLFLLLLLCPRENFLLFLRFLFSGKRTKYFCVILWTATVNNSLLKTQKSGICWIWDDNVNDSLYFIHLKVFMVHKWHKRIIFGFVIKWICAKLKCVCSIIDQFQSYNYWTEIVSLKKAWWSFSSYRHPE